MDTDDEQMAISKSYLVGHSGSGEIVWCPHPLYSCEAECNMFHLARWRPLRDVCWLIIPIDYRCIITHHNPQLLGSWHWVPTFYIAVGLCGGLKTSSSCSYSTQLPRGESSLSKDQVYLQGINDQHQSHSIVPRYVLAINQLLYIQIQCNILTLERSYPRYHRLKLFFCAGQITILHGEIIINQPSSSVSSCFFCF